MVFWVFWASGSLHPHRCAAACFDRTSRSRTLFSSDLRVFRASPPLPDSRDSHLHPHHSRYYYSQSSKRQHPSLSSAPTCCRNRAPCKYPALPTEISHRVAACARKSRSSTRPPTRPPSPSCGAGNPSLILHDPPDRTDSDTQTVWADRTTEPACAPATGCR